MPESLYALALLACPVGMGVMMWVMRGAKAQPGDGDTAAEQAEIAGLRAQIDQLKAAERDRERGAAGAPLR